MKKCRLKLCYFDALSPKLVSALPLEQLKLMWQELRQLPQPCERPSDEARLDLGWRVPP
jgi:hypothetical protein